MSKDILYIGLDISMNSTGLCLNLNQKHHKLYQIISIKDGEKLNLDHQIEGSTLIDYKRLWKKPFVEEDICKHISAERLANVIIDIINKYLVLYSIHIENVWIGIEGTSYGSRGQAATDIPVFSAIVKRKLLTKFRPERIKPWAPKSVKKSFTGSGAGTKKTGMEDEWNKRFGKTNVPRGGKLDDLIDAYAISMIGSTTCKNDALDWNADVKVKPKRKKKKRVKK